MISDTARDQTIVVLPIKNRASLRVTFSNAWVPSRFITLQALQFIRCQSLRLRSDDVPDRENGVPHLGRSHTQRPLPIKHLGMHFSGICFCHFNKACFALFHSYISNIACYINKPIG